LRFKKTLAAEKRPETSFLSNAEKEKRIVDYVERESAGARNQVADNEPGGVMGTITKTVEQRMERFWMK
jgi:hypothetical protein